MDREQQSVQENFTTDYFLVSVDMTFSQLNSRFEQMQILESIFGFLFDASLLISMDDDEMKICCMQLEIALKHGEMSNINAYFFTFRITNITKNATK